MNEQAIIKKMIIFIEQKEHELQANRMSADNHVKNDVVKSILDKLESEMTNENN